jgi:hypothetical protein
MSMTFLVEIGCDAEGCECALRAWNWATLGAIAELRAEVRRADWLTVKTSGKHIEHYCPAHKSVPEPGWEAGIRRANRANTWVKGK